MSAQSPSADSSASPMQARLTAAIAEHRAGKLTEAEMAYRGILADEPDNPDALHLLGALKQQSGKADEAISLVRQAIARKPQSGLYHNTLGIAYAATQAFDWAVEAFTKAIELAPKYPDPHLHLGNLMRLRGRKEEAAGHFERAIALKPEFIEAHNNLGTLLIDMEQWKRAEGHLMTAAGLRPKSSEIAINLAVARRAIDSKAAIAGLEQVLKAQPNHPAALTNLGAAYADLGERDLAVDHLRKAVAAAPDNVQIKLDLANALSQFGQQEEARTLYGVIAEEGPPAKRLSAILALAAVAEQAGDFSKAAEYYDQAYRLRPDAPGVVAGLLKRQGAAASDDLVRKAEAMARDEGKLPEARGALQMALGGVQAGRKEFDRAFAAYRQGNALRQRVYQKRGITYDRQAREARIDSIIRTYDAEFFRIHGRAGSDSNLPIFVVGMPRSGTTLSEQILASHSDVFGADELMDITMAAARLDPGNYRRLATGRVGPLRIDAQQVHGEANRYLGVVRAMSPEAKRIVDKYPANLDYLGLIATMFPHGKIVHCQRDPRDVAWSCFTTNFLYPLVWSLDLDNFAHYYTQYQRLMDHWRQVLPVPFLDRRYEEAVGDFEIAARRLLDFCGLEWQDACLEFYKTERTVRTASIQQVRQPVYTSSIGRWRDYEAFAPDAFRRIGELLRLN
jgi:tetratricopeptide (TPR) repeat protein